MKTIIINNAQIFLPGQIVYGSVYITDGRIINISETMSMDADRVIDAQGNYLFPSCIDTHIHGFAGYGVEDFSVDAIQNMSYYLAQYGVGSFFPTVYTDDIYNMFKAIDTIVASIGTEKGARIAGIHLEGPFLSKAKKGVQKSEYILDIDMDLMKQFVVKGKGHVKNMTVAPEQEKIVELVQFCATHNIVLQAGHTDATSTQIQAGMRLGIMHATHFYNAMRQLEHRNPGCVGAFLSQPAASMEIICDGHHVNFEAVQIARMTRAADRIVLITDSLRPTQQKIGKLIANGEEMYEENGIFRRVKDNVIGGSCVTMTQAIYNYHHYCNASLSEAVACASRNPAQLFGLKQYGDIAIGYHADMWIAEKTTLQPQVCIINGTIVYET